MFHFKSIKTKITFLSLSAIFLTAAFLVVVVLWEKVPLQKKIMEELDILSKSETSKIARDIYFMCRAQDDILQKKLSGDVKSAQFVLQKAGDITLNTETVSWNVINPSNNSAKPIRLAKMTIGGVEIAPGGDQKQINPIIAQIHNVTGENSAIFQRLNESGDFVCIASSGDESLPVGTYIPATSSNEQLSQALTEIGKGNAFQGRLFFGNAWHFTAFEPILDQTQSVIGAIYIGLKEDSLQALRKGIMEIQVGKTGYAYVIRGSGDQKGYYVISKNGERDGENIWENKDTNGRFFIQSVIQKGTNLKKGAIDFEVYSWKNEGEDNARSKIVAITYFEPWDWVIGAGTYQDDFHDTQVSVDNSLRRLVLSTMAIAAILLMVFAAITFVFSGKITSPLKRATLFAQKVADGDLSQRLEITQIDETGLLGNALNDMVVKLNEVSKTLTSVARGDLTQSVNQKGELADAVNQMSRDLNEVMMQIQSAAQQVAASSEELSSSAQNLSSSTTEQSSALEETSASIEELAASVEQNAKNSGDANDIIGKAAKDAAQGGRAVIETVDAMRKIAQTIAVVNDIADQTNLLALNAAIEAARAGDMGKGFAVVAVEVRKLAERSQQAAKEISELAANSVTRAETAGGLIQQIVPDIQHTAKLMEEINMTCQEQTSGANQIRQAITSLDQVTQENSSSSEETASASEELDSQAQFLQQLVGRFKISGQQPSTEKVQDNGKEIQQRIPRITARSTDYPPETGRRIPHDASLSRIPEPVRFIRPIKDENSVEFREF